MSYWLPESLVAVEGVDENAQARARLPMTADASLDLDRSANGPPRNGPDSVLDGIDNCHTVHHADPFQTAFTITQCCDIANPTLGG